MWQDFGKMFSDTILDISLEENSNITHDQAPNSIMANYYPLQSGALLMTCLNIKSLLSQLVSM